MEVEERCKGPIGARAASSSATQHHHHHILIWALCNKIDDLEIKKVYSLIVFLINDLPLLGVPISRCYITGDWAKPIRPSRD